MLHLCEMMLGDVLGLGGRVWRRGRGRLLLWRRRGRRSILDGYVLYGGVWRLRGPWWTSKPSPPWQWQLMGEKWNEWSQGECYKTTLGNLILKVWGISIKSKYNVVKIWFPSMRWGADINVQRGYVKASAHARLLRWQVMGCLQGRFQLMHHLQSVAFVAYVESLFKTSHRLGFLEKKNRYLMQSLGCE